MKIFTKKDGKIRKEDETLSIPNDPVILLSYVNTKLRDFYADLDEFCKAEGLDKTALQEKLKSINYEYSAQQNRFI